MGKDDARKLDHNTLEALRMRAVRAVQAGKIPRLARESLGGYRTGDVWLAGALSARRLGRSKGQTLVRASAEVGCARDAMDLRYGDEEQSIAAAILIRAVDARDGGGADQNYPHIKALAREEGADIYFGDAAHIRSDHHAGRAWGARGETPIVRATGARHGMSLISAIASRGHMRFMIVDKGSVNAGVFIEFLKRLINGAARKIFLIVDRGSARRAKKVSAFVTTLGGKLRLFFLPPYAPDHNPDELVWKHLKADTAGRMAVTSREDLEKKVRGSMRDLQNDKPKLISFFQKPSLKYAA